MTHAEEVEPPSPEARRLGFVAAGALVVSYLLTWRLWSVRTEPPHLPGIEFLRLFEFGVPLVLTAAIATAFPRSGATAHAALLALAMLGDQLRMQPEFVSLAILLVAAAWAPHGLAIARWHLGTLWAWAGVHKALSAGWPGGGAAFIGDEAHLPSLRPAIAVAVPAIEIALGLLALHRRRGWPVLRVAAPAFHAGVLLLLASGNSNSAVWPWNAALGAAAVVLFAPHPAASETRVRRPRFVAFVVVAMVVYPGGFYAGFTDTYLAHNLYSSNGARASVCIARASGCEPARFPTSALNVPIPPEPRLYRAWFRRTCFPGEVLRVDGRWTRLWARQTDYVDCR